ncbi:MAG: hypothetical protein HOO96_14045 [Polyangiaceae bacterium]|nr:hypothetical protein [Polyangiaceae bacterium]
MALNSTTARTAAIAFLNANINYRGTVDWNTLDPSDPRYPILGFWAGVFESLANHIRTNGTIAVSVSGTTSTPNVASGGVTAPGTTTASGTGTLT